MNRLLNLTPVRKSVDVIALRNLYDQLEINIRGLESLEISPDSYSCLLFPIIMKAIPPDLALEYNKKRNEKQSQITDFTAYLRREVESRERTEYLVKPHDSQLKINNSYIPILSISKERLITIHSQIEGFKNTHVSDLCENLCVQEKGAKLIQEGRCFICCNTGCYVKKCKKEVCSYCKGRHARAICFKLEKSKQNSRLDLEEKNVDIKTASSNSVFHNRGGVLLQCVKAEIIGRSSSDKIFCLFDNGNSSLVAVETSLGWPLQGRCDEQSYCTSVHLVHSEQESISAELRRFWEIESLGILDKDSVTLGNGDEEILVIRIDKTTSRIRIVFDGSAHEDGQSSLNLSLYTGPNLHPNILELLLCFRKSSIAFTADVKSAFLQIELDLRDRDFTRFFWTDNLNNEPYVLNFTRVLFGLRPSPYLLAATLKHHFKKYKEQYPHTFELLNSSIYVDDLICGQNNVPDALRTTLECLQIFSDAGMLLRKWQTNSKQLDLLWQQEDVAKRNPLKLRRIEKIFLSVVGRIFDPIGILGPFVIKLKCLLQELWTLGVEWDSELPQSYDTSGSSGVAKLRARLR
ncbi:DUF1758 domain-containing protein [Trichonephila inaurata madagascariensis]|uniref:DUF1758 domain-containing protein n=1 Tax=Trichonephila inaurata madagascariensis TaxID=2747483 RepID=A0A8X6X839_9ARAC|nr:DUF1758 domain-containing protein [Trichonephila inaurata madagascariensis]GFY48598.1 DUF1758 domain-containing protein [Trichonephila inaurata madagascariensis]